MRITKRKNCHNRDANFLKKSTTPLLLLFFLSLPCQTQAQDHVTFCGMELGTDIKEDSVFLRGKGCWAYKKLFESFVDFSYYMTDQPIYISLHYSPLSNKVCEVYVLMMEDKDMFDYYNNRMSSVYGKPFSNINGESFWRIKNKKGKTIGEACLLKEKTDGHGLGIIITDKKSHQEALKQSKTYSNEGDKYFDLLLDKSVAQPKCLLVTHIDSLENCGRQLVNDVYIIYAVDDDGKEYKVLSHDDRSKKSIGKRIKKNGKYRMKLELYLFSTQKESRQRTYFGNKVCNEPERGLYNLYVTGSLNGLNVRK